MPAPEDRDQQRADLEIDADRPDRGAGENARPAVEASDAPTDRLRRHWDTHAAQWTAWARTPGVDTLYWRHVLPGMLALLPPPGRLTLDAGCGEGRTARALRDHGHRVLGVDSSPALVLAAATHPQSPVTAACADLAALPLPDGCCDLITASFVLGDVDDLTGSVAELGRVLIPGGALVVAVPHPLATAGRFRPLQAEGEPRAESADAGAPFVVDGSYLSDWEVVGRAERAELAMTVRGRHRPIETYVEALRTAGMVVEALREPPADDLWAAEEPAVARWRRIPGALFLRARRLSGASTGGLMTALSSH